MSKKRTIVISGINITEAGPLSVMKDLLAVFSENKNDFTELIVLVHDKALYDYDNITYLEFPKSKKSWFLRLYYEYFYFKKLSLELKPDYWISMHDMTPNVVCNNRYVYCHNATPYYSPTWKDWLFGSRASLFSLFYIFLYSINIKKNTGVIVQQDWFRKALVKRFKLNNVIVAYPDIKTNISKGIEFIKNKGKAKKIFFPSYPRSFKNVEIICEAYKKLSQQEQENLEVFLTLDNTLNSYASYIYKKYNNLKNINFIGLQTREKVFDFYEEVDALVFPSKLESWGLPITEFKPYQKPIILSDLPYAKETLGTYDFAYFFDPNSSEQLAKIFSLLIRDELTNNKVVQPIIEQPFVQGWQHLYEYIFTDE